MSIVNLGIFLLAAGLAFVFYSRFKEKQAEEADREDDEVAEGLLEALDPALRVDG